MPESLKIYAGHKDEEYIFLVMMAQVALRNWILMYLNDGEMNPHFGKEFGMWYLK